MKQSVKGESSIFMRITRPEQFFTRFHANTIYLTYVMCERPSYHMPSDNGICAKREVSMWEVEPWDMVRYVVMSSLQLNLHAKRVFKCAHDLVWGHMGTLLEACGG